LTLSSIAWQLAEITRIKQETPQARSFSLVLPAFTPHRPGQHYDLRLTAEDGYQAQRSYSIASEPERTGEIDLTIDRLEDGEVSGYMHDVVVPGDRVEVRGPIGGYFVWDAPLGGPLLLLGGGSGIVPLMAMVRHRAAVGSTVPSVMLNSFKTYDDVIYRDELDILNERNDGLRVFHTLTRSQPAGWKGYGRRLDAAMLREAAGPLSPDTKVFICGPTAFVEAAAGLVQTMGVAAGQIKTERFGASG
jgi:ferredoxin-NADP reductase